MTTIYKTRGGDKIPLLSLPCKAHEALRAIKSAGDKLRWAFVAFEDRIEVLFADKTTATYIAEENDYLCRDE